MKYLLLLMSVVTLGSSGCVIVPEYPAAQVVISGGGQPGPYHCPPGQAKKGRC
ncbi:hypothetical protein [Noviherbaspirillum sp.]|uniref:hypothetical protein n=1 Tax=Noviherbaspirillum sp. TaxID=1926288 RepID=UPI002B48DBDE|nr:hypothetical protein [Noviherbaspirillum sp.]HJV82603.1 hypothetical protein [Noviherbaspirillum sp.]